MMCCSCMYETSTVLKANTKVFQLIDYDHILLGNKNKEKTDGFISCSLARRLFVVVDPKLCSFLQDVGVYYY